MEDYQNYTVEDFVLDAEFRAWIKNPTSDSTTFWEEWQQTNPTRKHIVEQAISIIRHFPAEESPSVSYAERLQMIQFIESGIDAYHTKDGTNKDLAEEGTVVPLHIKMINHNKKISQHKFPVWAWGVAASLLLACVAFILFNNVGIKQQSQRKNAVVLVREQNPNGKKSVVLLKDGSRVTLNADSKLSYPAVFNSSKREVYLEGEAFFEVARDASRPFQVITGEIKTVALGTSFNIRAYPEDGNIQVALATGKVKIQHDKTLTVLEVLAPGEQLIYQKQSGVIKKEEVPQADISPWKTGILHFDHARSEEVFKTLERWYGVHFEIENTNPLPIDVNGKFEDESIENVLEALRYSMKFSYQKTQDTITIHYEK